MATPTVDEQFEASFEDWLSTRGPTGSAAIPQTPPGPAAPIAHPVFINNNGDTTQPPGYKLFSEVFGHQPKGIPDLPGKVFESDDWSEEVQAYIPAVDINYSFYGSAVEDMWMAHVTNDSVFLTGKPGVGKSSLVEQVCARVQQPFIRVNCRGDLESSALFGMMQVNDTGTYWSDGPVTDAVRHGACLLLDEVAALSPEIMMGMQWLGERGGKLLLADKPTDTASDKLVQPGEWFKLTMADNTKGQGDDGAAYAGTGVMNSATLNRVGTVIELDWMPQGVETDLLSTLFPNMRQDFLRNVTSLARMNREAFDIGELSVPMSLRSLVSMLNKLERYAGHGFPAADAARASYNSSFRVLLPDDGEAGLAMNNFQLTVESNL